MAGSGSDRGESEANGSIAADDMTPFLEQLQGGEGGDLHEVSWSQAQGSKGSFTGRIEKNNALD